MVIVVIFIFNLAYSPVFRGVSSSPRSSQVNENIPCFNFMYVVSKPNNHEPITTHFEVFTTERTRLWGAHRLFNLIHDTLNTMLRQSTTSVLRGVS